MNGVDTNVLVRYLTQDDPGQAAKVGVLMAEVEAADDRLFVSGVVLCELVWVLETAYRLRRREVAAALQEILAVRHLEFEDKDLLRLALEDYRASRADFADCVIGRLSSRAGCTTTWTLDRGTRGLPWFRLL